MSLLNKIKEISSILQEPRIIQYRSTFMVDFYEEVDFKSSLVEQARDFIKKSFPKEQTHLFSESLEKLLISDLASLGPLDLILESNEWMHLTVDHNQTSIIFKNLETHCFNFGFGSERLAICSFEKIASELNVRISEEEPLFHRQWKKYVVTAGIKPFCEVARIRLTELSYYERWLDPMLPP